MWAIKFWDNFSTSSVKRSPSEFPSIWDMELLAKFNLRRLVMLTKSLASIVWMWFSDKSLEDERSMGQDVRMKTTIIIINNTQCGLTVT